MATAKPTQTITLVKNPDVPIFQYRVGDRVKECQTYHFGTVQNGFCKPIARSGKFRVSYMVKFDDGVHLIMGANALEKIGE